MPRYTVTVEYMDEDGDLVVGDAVVEADDAMEAQDAVLEDVTEFLDDADEDEHDAHVIAVQESDE